MDAILSTPRYAGLSVAQLRELTALVHGDVYNRDHVNFGQQTRLWNGNIICKSKALVCPLDAHDVSRVLTFCAKHALSHSVKAGGYAVAGWAVAGDIILDLCLLCDVSIEPPVRSPVTTPTGATPPASAASATTAALEGPLAAVGAAQAEGKTKKARDWTSLRDMPRADVRRPAGAQGALDKGKARAPYLLPRADSTVGVGGKRARTPDAAHPPSPSPAADPTSSPGEPKAEHVKRRKEEASAVERLAYDGASRAAAQFLRGGALPPDPRLPFERRVPPTSSTGPPQERQVPPTRRPAMPARPGVRRSASDVSMRTPATEDRDPFGYMFDGPPTAAPPAPVSAAPPLRANGRHTPRRITGPPASSPTPTPKPAASSTETPKDGEGEGEGEGEDTCGAQHRSGLPVTDAHLARLSPSARKEAAATTTALPDGDTPLAPPAEFAARKVAARAKGKGREAGVDPFAYLADEGEGVRVDAGTPMMEGEDGDGESGGGNGVYLDARQPGRLAMSPGAMEARTPSTGPSSAGTPSAGGAGSSSGSRSSGSSGSSGNGSSTSPSNGSSTSSARTSSGAAPDLVPDGASTAMRGAPAVPRHPHAYVTFGAGMRQREVDMFCDTHRLPARAPGGAPVPYHVPFAAHPVGSAVMITGGFGFLSRLYGLSVDALVEVEMVLADGRVVVVSEDEHPDLWWAVRGGGPAFGIATRYKARAFPVPAVFAGNLIYRFHRATAPSLLKHVRDCVKSAPRELYANVLLTAGPAEQDSIVVIQLCYVGPREKGAACLHALASWDGADCLLNDVDEKSFLSQQDSVAQVLRGQHGRKWFIRSTLINSLPDDIIHKTVSEFADTPIGCTWLFELSGGALADHTDSALNPALREAVFTVAALHQWEVHVDDPRCKTSAEKWVRETLAPVSAGAPFTCFLGREEPVERIRGCFGPNWDRLVELKRKYDPTNVFRHNFWPLDAEGRELGVGADEPDSP